jgi:hypothetical protein
MYRSLNLLTIFTFTITTLIACGGQSTNNSAQQSTAALSAQESPIRTVSDSTDKHLVLAQTAKKARQTVELAWRHSTRDFESFVSRTISTFSRDDRYISKSENRARTGFLGEYVYIKDAEKGKLLSLVVSLRDKSDYILVHVSAMSCRGTGYSQAAAITLHAKKSGFEEIKERERVHITQYRNRLKPTCSGVLN